MEIKEIIKNVYFINEKMNKDDVLNYLINKHYENKTINDINLYKEEIYKRETLSSTGVGNKIAIPHALGSMVNETSVIALVNKEGIEFDAIDHQKVHIFFMLAVKNDEGSEHLQIISKLSQVLMNEEIVDQLIQTDNINDFINLISLNKEERKEEDCYDVLAVTACPTGVAHTYMAAEALMQAASIKGIKIKVETNGASGIDHLLSDEDIKQAKCIIVAADKKVEMERFNNKHLIKVPVAYALGNAEELLDKAIHQDAEIYEGVTEQNENNQLPSFYIHLMNGISQIIPILMIFGILNKIVEGYLNESNIIVVGTLYYIANTAYTFALPILSGYIADSIADRPGFVVGLISGGFGLMFNMQVLEIMIIGFLSGYLVKVLNILFKKLPKDFHSIIPNLLLPLSGTLIIGMLIVMIDPYRFDYLTFLTQNQSIIINVIIGIVLGLMMSIDMGGPINKTAYTIGIIGIFIGRYDWMCAVMIGGMLPPIVIGITMILKKSLFSKEQLDTKARCFIKGLCFVSEEAIPYMMSDKRGFHYPCLIASAIAGGLSMYFGCAQAFPHGGIFTIFFIDHYLEMLLILLGTSIIGAILVCLFKKKMI